jgi:uncharacterized membrane protein
MRHQSNLGTGIANATTALALLKALRARTGLGGMLLLGAAGGALYYAMHKRGGTGPLMGRPLRARHRVRIARPAQELYDFWRNFENLPQFMPHLEAVQVLDSQRSRWTVKGPMHRSVEWESEVTHDVPGKEIGWRSLPGAEVENAGIVRFRSLGTHGETELDVELAYLPPGGKLGAVIAGLFGENPQQQLVDDLQRFKDLMERGSTSELLGERDYRPGADTRPF